MLSQKEKGFTLIEILVGIAVASIVTTAIYSTFTVQQKIYLAQKQIADIQQSLRTSMYLLEDNIKLACFDSLGTAQPRILEADSGSFMFQADLNENGHFFTTDGSTVTDLTAQSGTDPNETVGFNLSQTENKGTRSLIRRIWNGRQVMADSIEALDFVYLDANGTVLGPLPLDQTTRNSIRSVEITLIARSLHPGQGYRDTGTYRNLQGAVLIDCSDENPVNCNENRYYRRSLTRTIYLRNKK